LYELERRWCGRCKADHWGAATHFLLLEI